MKRAFRVSVIILIALGIVGVFYWLLKGAEFDILQPGGHIAQRELELLIFALILCAAVVIPVFLMLFLFSWLYRDSSKKNRKYKPDWSENAWLEVIWWGVPVLIIGTLAVVTWFSTHELDPYKKLDSSISQTEPVEVQVIALQWKWLFIYPQYGVASTGELVIPDKTPINFTITSDAPMNSFWIPKLGGQIYAMSAMSTKLSLIADQPGNYRGYSANISGEGFAGMKFTAKALPADEFMDWTVFHQTSPTLNIASYEELAKPGILDHPLYYSLGDTLLYDKIVDKYMLSDQAFIDRYFEPKSAIHGDDRNKDNQLKNNGAGR